MAFTPGVGGKKPKITATTGWEAIERADKRRPKPKPIPIQAKDGYRQTSPKTDLNKLLTLNGKATQSAPKPVAPKFKPAPVVARTTASPVVNNKATGSSTSSVASKPVTGGINPNLPPGAPGGPKKSAAQLATEKKMRDAAALKTYMDQASSAVQAELMPALNELNRQIADLQARGLKAQEETGQRGKRSEADLAELFGRLGNFTGEIQKASGENYQRLNSQVGDTYDALKAQLNSTYNGAQAASTAEQDRLGIAGLTANGNNANASMSRDQSWLTGLADVDKAAGQTAMSTSQNSFDQLMAMARNNAATEGTVRVGQSQRDTDKALTDIAFELESALRDTEGQRGDIEMGRGEKIRQMIEALQDRDYNRNMEQQQIKFQQDLAERQFGLEKQQINAALSAPAPAPSAVDLINAQKAQIELDNLIAEQNKNNRLGTDFIRIDPKTGRQIITNPNSGFTPYR